MPCSLPHVVGVPREQGSAHRAHGITPCPEHSSPALVAEHGRGLGHALTLPGWEQVTFLWSGGAAPPARPQFKNFLLISPADHSDPSLIPSIHLSGGLICALHSPRGAGWIRLFSQACSQQSESFTLHPSSPS